jgi:hypothetical protein
VLGGVIVAVAGLALAGCALGPTATTATSAAPGASPTPAASATSAAPAASARTAASDAAPAASATSNEVSSGPAPAQHPARTAPTPVQAIRVFATAYINWNASTVTADMQVLATVSVGQARSAMQLAAADTAQDYELRHGGIANSGTVEAVAPLAGARNEYVVVTRERTSSTDTNAYQGLQPAWHLTIATVTRAGAGRWVISGWQPES